MYHINRIAAGDFRQRHAGAGVGTAVDLDLDRDGKRFVALLAAESPEPRATRSHIKITVNFFDGCHRVG
jgi:hypothetical protein